MKILLLSPYDAPSHAYWREALCQHFARFEWTCLTLPARYFSWRIRGNSLTWGLEQRPLLERHYDLLLATSMTDLATLRGLVPALAQVPTVLYFHENQFAYPKSGDQHPSVEPQMVSLFAAICADRLAFNSQYNRTTFLQGVAQLLRRLPDAVPAGVLEQLTAKSQVLPVPIAAAVAIPGVRSSAPPIELVWNHRWEYDKGPEVLLQCLERLPLRLPLRVHVAGQQFRRQPPDFENIRRLLAERGWLGHWGYIEDRREYAQLLASSHLVLSTAHHDFQGLAVLEAVSAGCVPLVPDRLAYPEWFAESYRYSCPDDLTAKLNRQIEALLAGVAPVVPDLSRLSWRNLECEYSALMAMGKHGG
jgi:glycosyltransferase involved in cell wall biosynthesis